MRSGEDRRDGRSARIASGIIMGLVAGLSGVPSPAQSGDDFQLEVQDASGYEEEVVTTHVLLSNGGESGIDGGRDPARRSWPPLQRSIESPLEVPDHL
jgi:hypothetical protein